MRSKGKRSALIASVQPKMLKVPEGSEYNGFRPKKQSFKLFTATIQSPTPEVCRSLIRGRVSERGRNRYSSMIAREIGFDLPPIKAARKEDVDELLENVGERVRDSNYFKSLRAARFRKTLFKISSLN